MSVMKSSGDATFQRGLDAYTQGEHYDAHEHWESLWEDEDDDDTRRFLQALIQVASAMHKVRNGVEPRGALRLFERAQQKLEGLADGFGGIDLVTLRAEIERSRAALPALLAGPSKALAALTAPTITRVGSGPALRARSEPPPAHERFAEGVASYRAGRFYEAHEHWEVLWRDEPEPGRKTFLQGLILVAAAMHKLVVMGSPEGAERLFARADERLAKAPLDAAGLAVGELRLGIDRARGVLARLVAEARTDWTAVPPPRLSTINALPS